MLNGFDSRIFMSSKCIITFAMYVLKTVNFKKACHNVDNGSNILNFIFVFNSFLCLCLIKAVDTINEHRYVKARNEKNHI